MKPFDIDLNWMSKFRNQEKAAFWMADDDYGMIDLPHRHIEETFKLTKPSRTSRHAKRSPRRRQHHTTLRQNPPLTRPVRPHRSLLQHNRAITSLQRRLPNLVSHHLSSDSRPPRNRLHLLCHRRAKRHLHPPIHAINRLGVPNGNLRRSTGVDGRFGLAR